MDRAVYNSIGLLIIGSFLSFIAARYWFTKNAAVAEAKRLADEHHRLNERVRDLEKQLSAVGQSILPISAAFQALLIKELTHYHTPEMDKLMQKIGPPNTLTEVENKRLVTLLMERTRDMDGRISESERDAAVMLPMVMKRAKADFESDAAVKLNVVTSQFDDKVKEN